MKLFDNECIELNLPDADFFYYPNFFKKELADELFDKIKDETNWKHDEITIFGKKILQPRLTALYGNLGKPYSYSGLHMQPNKWTPLLTFIKEQIEKQANLQFTTVLLNLYRNQNDSNGWHSDNERELGRDPIIASVSLGETRKFQIKHVSNKLIKKDIQLEHGSLLIMKSGSQVHYKHQLPKSNQVKKERINLTFRTII